VFDGPEAAPVVATVITKYEYWLPATVVLSLKLGDRVVPIGTNPEPVSRHIWYVATVTALLTSCHVISIACTHATARTSDGAGGRVGATGFGSPPGPPSPPPQPEQVTFTVTTSLSAEPHPFVTRAQ
jgi:hypothetical protein